jgi:hypothetical protein
VTSRRPSFVLTKEFYFNGISGKYDTILSQKRIPESTHG